MFVDFSSYVILLSFVKPNFNLKTVDLSQSDGKAALSSLQFTVSVKTTAWNQLSPSTT